MKNKNMIEYKESFISKIKKFFINLFKSKNEENTYVQEVDNLNLKENISNKTEKAYFDDIKIDPSDINNYVDKKNFLKYVDGNVDALNLLSTDRLLKLEEYYNEVIQNNKKTIEKLKKSS